MIFQWYGGSDNTGRIPRRLNELLVHLRETVPLETLVRELEALAQEEQDPNMRAKIFFEIGRLYGHSGQYGMDLHFFEKAATCFDLLSASFQLVAQEYVRVAFALAGRGVDAAGAPLTQFDDAPHVLAALLWGDQGRLEKIDWVIECLHLAAFFRECADVFHHPLFAQLSLIAAARAHHGDSEEPSGLLALAHAYGRLGDKENLRRVIEMLKEVDFTGEWYRAAVEQWGEEGDRGAVS